MDRKTLLECTEKISGDHSMFDTNQQILNLSKEVKELNEQNTNLTNQIETETNLQTRAAEELRIFLRFNAFLQQLYSGHCFSLKSNLRKRKVYERPVTDQSSIDRSVLLIIFLSIDQ